jgi:hypothetical protein
MFKEVAICRKFKSKSKYYEKGIDIKEKKT